MSRLLHRIIAAALGMCTTASLSQMNECSASTKPKIVPPSQWWGTPHYSPDGSKVAVQSPAPEIVETKGPDGKIHKSQKGLPQGTVILNTKDNSLVSAIDCSLFPMWSPNGKFICGRCLDHKSDNLDFVIFDAMTGKRLSALKLKMPDFCAWSPDSTKLLITQQETAAVYDLQKKEEIALSTNKSETNFASPAWSPDGRLLSASFMTEDIDDENYHFKIWNVVNQNAKTEIKVSGRPHMGVWTPDGKRFVYSEPFAVKALNGNTMIEEQVIETDSLEAPILIWSNDRSKLAYEDSGFIHVLDANTLSEKSKVQVAASGRCRWEWSPDDKFFLVSTSGTAALCDSTNGNYLGYKTWRDGYQINFSSDQKSIVVQKANDAVSKEPIFLPPPPGKSAFENGKLGSPGWKNHVSVKTIEECLHQFDKELSTENRKRFKEISEDGIGDFGGGSALLDSMMHEVYGDWNTNALQKFFLSRGITDPRNVDNMILVSYWRYLNGRAIDLEKQISKHVAWADRRKFIVRYKQQQPPQEVLKALIGRKSGASLAVSGIQSRFKIIAFLDEGAESAALLKILSEFNKNYSKSELSIVVAYVPPRLLDTKLWVTALPSHTANGASGAMQSNNSKTRLDDFETIDVSPEVIQSLVSLTQPSEFSKLILPQTIVIESPDMLKMRINRFNTNATIKALESVIGKPHVQN